MTVAFRADASTDIGTGHVARCLALAHAIREEGGECRFVCRDHPNHLAARIHAAGHAVSLLPAPTGTPVFLGGHGAWLGADWQTDATETIDALGQTRQDWLVVDHYALDEHWEGTVRAASARLMVIDDLADRPHDCELLLDQNLGRDAGQYAQRTPRDCRILVGPRYALLRPEFAEHRPYSLARRARPELRHVLVSMGGVDKDNVTGAVLEALKACRLPPATRVTCVMGAGAPGLDAVRTLAARMPWPTEVLVDTPDMARIMAESDVAIGAAGSTSWERCCLGVPTIAIVVAANQREAAAALQAAGAAAVLERERLALDLPACLEQLGKAESLASLSMSARAVTDGKGVARVVAALKELA